MTSGFIHKKFVKSLPDGVCRDKSLVVAFLQGHPFLNEYEDLNALRVRQI